MANDITVGRWNGYEKLIRMGAQTLVVSRADNGEGYVVAPFSMLEVTPLATFDTLSAATDWAVDMLTTSEQAAITQALA